jgi:hypothetical protein
MKKLDIPTYALVISIGFPVLYAVATITLMLLGQGAGTGLAAMALAFPGFTTFLVLNGLLAIFGAVTARSKGRKFGTFYFLGLVFPVVPTLVSLALKSK